MISRSDRGLFASWWFTVDRLLLSAVLLLMAAGVLISMAASPPVAERLGLDSFHFFKNQLFYLGFAVIILIATSLLEPLQARRAAFVVFLGSLALMVVALFYGPEIKGAHRWIDIGPVGLQPSELAKPAFIVMAAWFLGENVRRPEMPGLLIAMVLAGAFVGLLVLQPDFGQSALVVITFIAMLLIYGIPWILVFGLSALAGAGVFLAYSMIPHVASRIDRFLNPEKGDTFQVDTATQAFQNGGLFGTGPGGGEAKQILPDSHTDFTFAVVGEEFGFIACMGLIILFAFIVIRILGRAKADPDPFATLAMSGLAVIFGLQAVINMGVNVSLLPAKGMTLPFISYGGSSLMGMAFAMGLVLAFARARMGVAAADSAWRSVTA
ncbi:putative lipid II flippase FtsW [Taklimakanibacter lacteus]|uniref:putative lipid II flippase FtsW n=1 Tax=Taklimakanibacter lacteus TaxID=2268456 RepID=UPI003F68600C